MRPRYAVLFKVHFWDGFAERQLGRVVSRAASGDVFVVVDETKGPVGPIAHDRVLKVTEQEAVRAGLADAKTDASLFWYNIDYPHYLFFDKYPDYDYYVTWEYDVVVNSNIDDLVAHLAESRVDYLGYPLRIPAREWPWFEKHLAVYDADELNLALSCFAAFSHRAMELLRDRRLAMTRDFQTGKLAFWPNNEAFVPTEIKRAGFRDRSISDFGGTEHYDWWPPTHEHQLEEMSAQAFLHPVLEGGRYVRSVLHHEPRLLSFFRADSALRARLGRFPRGFYMPYVYREFRRRLVAAARRRLARRGLAQGWTAGAERSTQP